LYDTFSKLKQLFLDGFTDGLGDTSVFDSIQNHLDGIKNSLNNIFTDSSVVSAATGFVDKFVYSMGQQVGAITSIGATIADNVVGGIDKFLQQDSGRIKSFIVSMFDIEGSISEIKGNFSVAFADVFSIFRGDTAKQVTADIISIFADASMGAVEISSKIDRDILNLITKPFIDNKEQIKTALEGTLEVISSAVGTIKDLIQNTADKANAVYDAHIKPMFDALTQGVSDIAGTLLDFYNNSVKPILDKLAEKFKTVVESHVQPAIDKFLELFGKVADMITVLWQNVISPFIQWIITTIFPLLLPVIEAIGNTFLDVMADISDAIGGVITVISGIVDFITGVFSGDWELAWEGIKEIFSGFGDIIAGLASAIWESIKLPFSVAITFFGGLFSLAWEAIKNAWSSVSTWFQSVWDSITNIFINVGTWFKDKFDSAWTLIKNIFSISNISTWFTARWSDIKNVFSTVDSWFKEKFNNAWSRIKEIFSLSNVSTWFTSRYSDVKTSFDSADSWFDTKFGDAWTKIKGVFSQSSLTGWFGDRWGDIKNGFAIVDSWFGGKFGDAWEAIKKVFSTSTLKSFFGDDGVWGTIKGLFTNIGSKAGDAVGGAFKSVINSCLSTIEKTINKAIGFINGAINAINKLPGVSIGNVDPITLPRLAKGGVVNSATIAMIGEAGKEAVVPLENNTGWMDKIGNLIGNIVSTNLSMQLATAGESSSSTPIYVTVELDKRTLATAIADVSSRNGINFKE
jgi:phage-related protein